MDGLNLRKFTLAVRDVRLLDVRVDHLLRDRHGVVLNIVITFQLEAVRLAVSAYVVHSGRYERIEGSRLDVSLHGDQLC